MLVVGEDAVLSSYHFYHTDRHPKPTWGGGGERDCRGAALSDEQMPVKTSECIQHLPCMAKLLFSGPEPHSPRCAALVKCIIRKGEKGGWGGGGGVRQHKIVRNMLQVTEIP